MFILKKLLVPFILPPGIFVTAGLVAGLWNLRARRIRRACGWLLVSAAVWAALTGPFGDKALAGLEYAYTPPADVKADVIILLSGGLVEGPEGAVGRSLSGASLERAAEAARLYRRYKLPVIVSGGAVFSAPAESPALKRYLVSLGLPPETVMTEELSRDTYENAVYARKLCEEKGYRRPVVVTSAFHMKRAVFSFKKAGFHELVPYPAGYLSPGAPGYSVVDCLPGPDYNLRTALHEHIGLLYYRLRY